MDQARTCITPSVRNVNVRRLAILQTVEEEFVSTNPEQYRHCLSVHHVLTRARLRIRGSKTEGSVSTADVHGIRKRTALGNGGSLSDFSHDQNFKEFLREFLRDFLRLCLSRSSFTVSFSFQRDRSVGRSSVLSVPCSVTREKRLAWFEITEGRLNPALQCGWRGSTCLSLELLFPS